MHDAQALASLLRRIGELQFETAVCKLAVLRLERAHARADAKYSHPRLAPRDRHEQSIAEAGEVPPPAVAVLRVDDVDHARLVPLRPVDPGEGHRVGVLLKKHVRGRIDAGDVGIDAEIEQPTANRADFLAGRQRIRVDDHDVVVPHLVLFQVLRDGVRHPLDLLFLAFEADEPHQIVERRMVFEKLRTGVGCSVERNPGFLPQLPVLESIPDVAPEMRRIEHLHQPGVSRFLRFPIYAETERVRRRQHRPGVPVALLQDEVARVAVAVAAVEPDPGLAVFANAEHLLRRRHRLAHQVLQLVVGVHQPARLAQRLVADLEKRVGEILGFVHEYRVVERLSIVGLSPLIERLRAYGGEFASPEPPSGGSEVEVIQTMRPAELEVQSVPIFRARRAPGVDDAQRAPVRFFARLFDREVVDQAAEVPLERAGVERDGDPPLGMLSVQVSGLQRKDDGLARARETADALHAVHGFDDCSPLGDVKGGDGILQFLQPCAAGVRPVRRAPAAAPADGRDAFDRGQRGFVRVAVLLLPLEVQHRLRELGVIGDRIAGVDFLLVDADSGSERQRMNWNGELAPPRQLPAHP